MFTGIKGFKKKYARTRLMFPKSNAILTLCVSVNRTWGGGADKAARSPKPAQAGKGDSHIKEIDILSG